MKYLSSPLLALLMTMPVYAQAENFEDIAKRKAAEGYMFPSAPQTVPYSYVFEVMFKGQDGDDDMNLSAQYRVDPNAAPGERVTYLGEDEEALPEDFRKQITQVNEKKTMSEFAEDFWCSDAKEDEAFTFSGGTLVSENADTALISLTNEKVRDLMGEDEEIPKKVRKRLIGEMTFSKEEFYPIKTRVWLSKPTTVKIVAKMKEMQFETTCAKAPNGHYYNSKNTMSFLVKAMGKTISQSTLISISDLRPAKQP